MELTTLDIFQRIGIATVFGGVIGLERELHGQAAGLRTHAILAVGAALASIASIRCVQLYGIPGSAADPGRIAAQVVSGIGFLGGGAIIRYGANIRGLTTATSLWTIAVVGLVCGMGDFVAAGLATGLVLVSLTILDLLEKRVIPKQTSHRVRITMGDRPGVTQEVASLLQTEGIRIVATGFRKSMETQSVDLDFMVKFKSDLARDRMIGVMSGIPDIQSFEVK